MEALSFELLQNRLQCTGKKSREVNMRHAWTTVCLPSIYLQGTRDMARLNNAVATELGLATCLRDKSL